MIATVHVELPSSLCLIAGTGRKLTLTLETPVTQRRILDALELRYPMLCGTIRDRNSKARRPFIRFFACRNDLSHHSPDDPLPQAIADGTETFYVIAAIAGG